MCFKHMGVQKLTPIVFRHYFREHQKFWGHNFTAVPSTQYTYCVAFVYKCWVCGFCYCFYRANHVFPSLQLGAVTLAGWRLSALASVRAINRSASGFPNAVVFCCIRAGPSCKLGSARAYAPTSAKRGIAIVDRHSVRLSVSDVLIYRGRIGWITSKVIARVISLGSSLLGAPTSTI